MAGAGHHPLVSSHVLVVERLRTSRGVTKSRSVVDRELVLRYRATGHNLAARRPPSGLADVVGAVGLWDAQGSGPLSLHARLDGVTASTLDDARHSGELVEVVSARGVAILVPASDVAVFTIGSLPADEVSLRARLNPAVGLVVARLGGRTKAP